MNTLLAVLSGGLLGDFEVFCIICIIIWGVYALLTWLGIVIPQPVRIILTVLGCIILVVWLFRIAQQFL